MSRVLGCPSTPSRERPCGADSASEPDPRPGMASVPAISLALRRRVRHGPGFLSEVSACAATIACKRELRAGISFFYRIKMRVAYVPWFLPWPGTMPASSPARMPVLMSCAPCDAEPLHGFFRLFTHLGDSAFLLPLSIVIVGVLAYQDYPTGLRLGFVIAADLVLTFLLKLGFYALGGSTYLNILSPSGHASFSIAVYGCCAAALANRRRFAERVLIIGIALAVLLTIIASRIVLHLHTPEEAAVGSLVGGICVAAFSAGGSRLQRPQLRMPAWLLVLLMAGTVSAWAVGRRFPTERLIEHWGVRMGSVWEDS